MESKDEGKFIRKIRSFVIREGRLTQGQSRAITELWPKWGIEYQEELLNFAEIFGNDNPVTLEIGFGMGHSLVEMAKNAPKRNFLGIEVHTPGIGAILAAARDNGVENLRVIKHDAIEVLEQMIALDSLDRLQLFFPDPWHKARHHKRRIVKQEFLDLVIPRLKSNGVIHIATDWQEYADEILAILEVDERLENLAGKNCFAPRPQYRPITKFETRGIRLGHTVNDLLFKKK